MLNRLRIQGRLKLAVLVPTVALVAFAGLAIALFQSVRINGDRYREIVTLKDAQAELTPTEDNVLVAYAAAQRLLIESRTNTTPTPADVAQRDALMVIINTAERRFRRHHLDWKEQSRTSFDATATRLSLEAGNAFFNAMNEIYLPHIVDGNTDVAQLVLDNDITKRYQFYEDTVSIARTSLDVRQRDIERDVGRFTQRSLLALSVAAATAVLLAAGLGALVARSIEAERNDELGELTEALNVMQATAVELATEQAAARRAMAANLVHIGRRNQTLIDRTMGFISDLERAEQNPETLSNLFKLDHLTTRMRRNSESLLILAGSDPVTKRRSPEPISDVVRGALSEIESFDRVELAALEPVMIAPQAVRPLSHLLAELIENAAAFSPPEARVTVIGRTTHAGYHLAIIDRGIGMNANRLAVSNETLSHGHEFLTVASKTLGLQVVARLAERHGIRVRLADNEPNIGVTANVLVPSEVFRTTGDGTPDQKFAAPTRSDSAHRPLDTHALDTVPESWVGEVGGSRTSTPPNERNPLTPPPAPTAPPTTPIPTPSESILPRPATDVASPKPSDHPDGPNDPNLPRTTRNGLPRRIRGAQLLDAGPVRHTTLPPPLPEDQRSALASFQIGVRRAAEKGASQ